MAHCSGSSRRPYTWRYWRRPTDSWSPTMLTNKVFHRERLYWRMKSMRHMPLDRDYTIELQVTSKQICVELRFTIRICCLYSYNERAFDNIYHSYFIHFRELLYWFRCPWEFKYDYYSTYFLLQCFPYLLCSSMDSFFSSRCLGASLWENVN